jgi:hypothetical protein
MGRVITTKYCHRVVLALLLQAMCLVLSQTAHGHMLNMTRLNVAVDSKNNIVFTVNIDLGGSLMTSEDYWALSQAANNSDGLRSGKMSEEVRLLVEPALKKLDTQVLLLADDVVVPRQLVSWEFPATSLEAIRNSLSPQMATLVYRASPAAVSQVSVKLAPSLAIPWPCLLRVDSAMRRLPISRLLTDGDRVSTPVNLLASEAATTDLLAQGMHMLQTIMPGLSWVAVGFTHIVPKGLDHIAFVLGLFFLATGLKPLLLQVTGFTIAHSLTLGLSMYGLVNVPASIVEPLIALSIVYIAIDNLFATRLAPWRLTVVCLFGLLHGLGFAAMLMEVRLPEAQFLSSLFLFNLGVELGQVSVLLGAFLVVGWCRQRSWYKRFVAAPATVAIVGAGAFWLLKRTVM